MFRKIAYVQGRLIHRFSHNYSDIAKDLGLPSIESFFDYADMSFLYKTFKENNCNSFISLFNVNDSAYKLRSERPFVNPKVVPDYIARNPITRLTIDCNELC